jgi:hypothetical protein
MGSIKQQQWEYKSYYHEGINWIYVISSQLDMWMVILRIFGYMTGIQHDTTNNNGGTMEYIDGIFKGHS